MGKMVWLVNGSVNRIGNFLRSFYYLLSELKNSMGKRMYFD
jgi:hypothetical protein